jgi:hypothetical protein
MGEATAVCGCRSDFKGCLGGRPETQVSGRNETNDLQDQPKRSLQVETQSDGHARSAHKYSPRLSLVTSRRPRHAERASKRTPN